MWRRLLLLGCSTALANPPGVKAERLVLRDGVVATTRSGLALKVTGADFETTPPVGPGLSAPATAVTRLAIECETRGQRETLRYSLTDGGAVSVTEQPCAGSMVRVESRRLDAGAWKTVVVVEPAKARRR